MEHSSELRTHIRPLAAASFGLGLGYTFTNYVTNIFSPYLIGEFHWSRSQFALLGLVVVAAVICQPVAGRLVDAIGVRWLAAIGVVSAPLLYLALGKMSGSFAMFYAINLAQVVLVGGTTSAVVYTRLIADRFFVRRGVALGIAASAPALAGALLAPVMGAVASDYGWRTGYVFVAGVVALGGLVAMLLAPPVAKPVVTVVIPRPRTEYRTLLRNPALPILLAGVILCNLTLTVQMTEVKLVLGDAGVTAGAASLMISLYGLGTIAGRLLCGVALDRLPAHAVAAVVMMAPAAGLLTLGFGTTRPLVMGAAVAILGVATGGEGDVGAYLVMRYFAREAYGTVFGIVMGTLALSGAVGAVLLSWTLRTLGSSFAPFLIGSGLAAIVGGLLFLRLQQFPARSIEVLPLPSH